MASDNPSPAFIETTILEAKDEYNSSPDTTVTLPATEVSTNDTEITVPIDDNDVITARNAVESPLLRLPAEIRLRIYEYAVGGHIIGESCYGGPTAGRLTVRAPWDFDPTNIAERCPENGHSVEQCEFFAGGVRSKFVSTGLPTGICRQIRSESIHCLFENNIFLLEDPESIYFLKCDMGSGVAAIKEISIETAISGYNGTVKSGPLSWGMDNLFVGENNMATTFPNLKRIFISPTMLSRYPHYAAMTAAELVAALLECEVTGVEVVFLDVLDRRAKLHKESVVKIPAAK